MKRAVSGARVSAMLVAGIGVSMAVVAACTEIPTDPKAVLSLAVDTLPAPAVVLGDSLRDSAGVARAVTVTAFNFQGEVIEDAVVRFSTRDRGIDVDSITGFVIGDSVRSTPARVTARVGGVEALLLIDVTLRPDSVAGVTTRDSLSYSLTDTAVNVSPILSVKVLHGILGDSVVKSYIVSFAVASPPATALARLVNDAGRASRIDTTDASGVAGRKIRIDPSRMTSLNDSVIVFATVKHRGLQVRGSPVRMVMKLKPKSP
ncbi:MAG TPA: hypothetical protein VM939_10235 [Gemmatimonadaceae bacterium]|nr:hypothetical protein [Gemmatimonadaceae bacterium]